jgi:hypothetical protein
MGAELSDWLSHECFLVQFFSVQIYVVLSHECFLVQFFSVQIYVVHYFLQLSFALTVS